MRKRNHPSLLVGVQIGTTTMEISMEIPQKTKNRTTISSSNPTPVHISRQNFHSKRYLHQYIHCSTIHNSQNMEKPICPLTDEWIKKMWYMFTMEY